MISDQSQIFDSVSGLLSYPQDGLDRIVGDCKEVLARHESFALESVTTFGSFLEASNIDRMQELYTRTFEINPVCALEVGWQLFGERYERGTFIVRMRQVLRDMNLPESTELPDHLVHVLQALGRMEKEEAHDFAETFVLPAMEKMLAGFKDIDNVYRGILTGIVSEMRERYNLPLQGVKHV